MTAQQLSTAANLLKNAGCTEVFLFGSQATGRAHAGSDVDLGVKGLPPRLFYRMHWQKKTENRPAVLPEDLRVPLTSPLSSRNKPFLKAVKIKLR